MAEAKSAAQNRIFLKMNVSNDHSNINTTFNTTAGELYCTSRGMHTQINPVWNQRRYIAAVRERLAQTGYRPIPTIPRRTFPKADLDSVAQHLRWADGRHADQVRIRYGGTNFRS